MLVELTADMRAVPKVAQMAVKTVATMAECSAARMGTTRAGRKAALTDAMKAD